MVSQKEQKIIDAIKKGSGITETGFKKNLQDNGLRISSENSKRLLIAMAKGQHKRSVAYFLKEQEKFVKLMKHLKRPTVKIQDVNLFQSLRYL